MIQGVRIIDRGDDNAAYDFSAVVDTKPSAIFFKGRCYGPMRASICGSCGYTEFYATNPEELYDAYQESLGNQRP